MTQILAALCPEGACIVTDSMHLTLAPSGVGVRLAPKVTYHMDREGSRMAFAPMGMYDTEAPVLPRPGLDFETTTRQLFADLAEEEAVLASATGRSAALGPPGTSPVLLAIGDEGQGPRLAHLSPSVQEFFDRPVIRVSGGWVHAPAAGIPELLAAPVPDTLDACISLLAAWAACFIKLLYAGRTLEEMIGTNVYPGIAFPLRAFTLTATAVRTWEIPE